MRTCSNAALWTSMGLRLTQPFCFDLSISRTVLTCGVVRLSSMVGLNILPSSTCGDDRPP
jgi:hypothetical protein